MVVARMEAHRSLVDTFLEREFRDNVRVPDRLQAAMRHGVLGGGKRFRPFLVIEAAALFGIQPVDAVRTASALECLHCYSLVHDDLPAMDNDRLRRGQPTVWAAFDDWTAILAGDGLLTLAFELLSHPETHPDPAIRCRLIAALANSAGGAGMVGGQALDLMADKLSEPSAPDLEHVRQLQSMKTGALIQFACEAGAIIGEGAADQREALRRYGENLGVVFQIADDLLDAEGEATIVGKATGKDRDAGKATQVSLLGADAARRLLRETMHGAIDALAPFGAAGDTLRDAARFAAERTK